MKSEHTFDSYMAEVSRCLSAVDHEQFDRAIEIIVETWSRNGTVYIMGNGGSASTASHFACDLAKGTIVEGRRRLRVMSLVDNVPLVSAWTNDSGFGSVFVEQLRPWLHEGDTLIGISVHGGSGDGEAGPWSQNLVQATDLARQVGAKIIGFSGFGGGALARVADACLTIAMDREPLGTPVVESVHVALHHLMCITVRERIRTIG